MALADDISEVTPITTQYESGMRPSTSTTTSATGPASEATYTEWWREEFTSYTFEYFKLTKDAAYKEIVKNKQYGSSINGVYAVQRQAIQPDVRTAAWQLRVMYEVSYLYRYQSGLLNKPAVDLSSGYYEFDVDDELEVEITGVSSDRLYNPTHIQFRQSDGATGSTDWTTILIGSLPYTVTLNKNKDGEQHKTWLEVRGYRVFETVYYYSGVRRNWYLHEAEE
jgi:hypothetical protein